MNDPKWLQTISTRENKATKRPWTCDERVGCVAVYEGPPTGGCIENGRRRLAYFAGERRCLGNGRVEWEVAEQDLQDARFMGNARTDVPLMRDMLRLLAEPLSDALKMYDELSLGPLGAAAKYGPDYEPPTDEDWLELRGAMSAALAAYESGKLPKGEPDG